LGSDPAVFVSRKGGGAMELLKEFRKVLQALASLLRAIKMK
jgi:hypothetical protein